MSRLTILVIYASIPASLLWGATPAADSARGAQVFDSESCSQCHRINGAGPLVGPDLGRLLDRGFTISRFDSTIWNHAPAMWASMQTGRIPVKPLDDQSAADLFAFFYSKRFFENPGDAGRGKALFSSKSCAVCHGLTDAKTPGARPVTLWTAQGDPIGMIEQMWNHASTMREVMAEKKVKWPRLSGQDIADLLVYLRNLPVTQQKTGSFQTGSPVSGEKLFASKGCIGCHASPRQFLSSGLAGQTLTDVAADMWNHGVTMVSAKVRFEPGEMRDIASYIWTLRLLDTGGNAARGKKVFAAKSCATCHDDASSGAPSLSGVKDFTGVSMVAALWRHGPAMLESMRQRHLHWPHFDEHEMSDIIAYLNTREAPNAR